MRLPKIKQDLLPLDCQCLNQKIPGAFSKLKRTEMFSFKSFVKNQYGIKV